MADRIPPWHQSRVDTGDEVCDVERPGARPVRRAPWLLAEGESIVYLLRNFSCRRLRFCPQATTQRMEISL
jgi:hypothetical protein